VIPVGRHLRTDDYVLILHARPTRAAHRQ